MRSAFQSSLAVLEATTTHQHNHVFSVETSTCLSSDLVTQYLSFIGSKEARGNQSNNLTQTPITKLG